MSFVVIPNVSEGRDPARITELGAAAASGGARLLDVHSDPEHHRSVFTLWGERQAVIAGMVALATACSEAIDLSGHEGSHPRLGGLDVCPFVFTEDPSPAIEAARETAMAIGEEVGLPVLLYGAAASLPERRELPDLRRGGLERWSKDFASGAGPDAGPPSLDPRTGLICVGARRPLIAFNVWIQCPFATARDLAAMVRESSGGLPGVRALALDMGGGWSQVSMNLIDPDRTGIDDAFEAVTKAARSAGAGSIRGEIVGVPLARYMPDPEREAARQISPPGRSFESLLLDA